MINKIFFKNPFKHKLEDNIIYSDFIDNKRVTISEGFDIPDPYKYYSSLWIHNNVVRKNHLPDTYKYSVNADISDMDIITNIVYVPHYRYIKLDKLSNKINNI